MSYLYFDWYSSIIMEIDDEEALEIRRILLNCYEILVGEAPHGGGWTPKPETVISIKQVAEEDYEGNLAGFLEGAVVAFLNRNGGGVGKHPETKFFVNSYIVAESTLEYMRKHDSEIHGVFCTLTRHDGFSGLLHGEILSGETQYLEGPLSYGPPDPTTIRPSIYWMLACVMLKRFKTPEDIWLDNGTCKCLSLMNQVVPRRTAYQAEKRRLHASNKLRGILMVEAFKAIKEGTYAWLHQHRVATIYRNELGIWTMRHPDEEFAKALNEAAEVTENVTLAERDEHLRKLVGDQLDKQGKKITPITNFAPATIPTKKYAEVQLVEAWLSQSAFKKQLQAKEEE